jgi:WD40 repeat protein
MLEGYLRTIRQIQVTEKYLALAYGEEIEIQDPSAQTELFHIRPDFRDTIPYLKCFYVNKTKLACSAGNGWTMVNVFDLERKGVFDYGWNCQEPHPIEAISFSDDKLVTGSRKCIVWDIATKSILRTFSEQQRGVVNCLQFDDEILVCSHKGRKVRIWDIKSGKRIFTIQGHQHLVHCLQYDSKVLATGSKDNTVRIWDKYKGYQCSGILRGHSESVRTLSLQGWRVVSGSKDGDVRIWDITSQPQVNTTSVVLNQSPINIRSSQKDTEKNNNFNINLYKQNPILVPEANGNIRTRSVGRITGHDPVFSIATSSSKIYVGTKALKVYDYCPPIGNNGTKKPQSTLDKFLNIFTG